MTDLLPIRRVCVCETCHDSKCICLCHSEQCEICRLSMAPGVLVME